jgi:hypothetical protein
MRGGFQRGGFPGVIDPLKHYFGIGFRGAPRLSEARGMVQRTLGETLVGSRRMMGIQPLMETAGAQGFMSSMAPYLGTIAGGDPRSKMRMAGRVFRGRQIGGAVGVGLGAIGVGATVGWGNVGSMAGYGVMGAGAGAMLGGLLGAGKGWGRGMGKFGAAGGIAYGAFRAMGAF